MRISPISLCLVAFIVALPSSSGAEKLQWEEPYPGVEFLKQSLEGPVQAWAARVDLCAAGVEIRATSEEEFRQTTSSFGRSIGAQVAINGGFYEPDFSPTGFAMGDGEVWSEDIEGHGFIGFGSEGASIWAPRMRVEEVPGGLSEAVGGYDSVVVDGEIPDFHQRFCEHRHPRTAVGLSQDGETLLLGVVDGRSEESRGMTCTELGQWMLDLGAWQALNLDGGGSTTMWTESKGVVNRPSAGLERVVSNHLAIFADGDGTPSACPREIEKIAFFEVETEAAVVQVDDDRGRSVQERGCSNGGGPVGLLAWLVVGGFARIARSGW